MSHTQHTPGPWSAWLGGGGYSITGPAAAAAHMFASTHKESPYGFYVEMSSGAMECPCIALGNTKERAEANAQLIAAAPAMLAVLKHYVMAFEKFAITNTDSSDMDHAGFLYESAQLAIKQATGDGE